VLLTARRQALQTNADVTVLDADIELSTNGSDWYWAACALMLSSALVFLGLGFTKPREDRIFHHITAALTLIAGISYFTMASGLGQVPVFVEFSEDNFGSFSGTGVTREIFYVRYIDW
jgi:bacteriorhodopsin